MSAYSYFSSSGLHPQSLISFILRSDLRDFHDNLDIDLKSSIAHLMIFILLLPINYSSYDRELIVFSKGWADSWSTYCYRSNVQPAPQSHTFQSNLSVYLQSIIHKLVNTV